MAKQITEKDVSITTFNVVQSNQWSQIETKYQHAVDQSVVDALKNLGLNETNQESS